MHEQGSTAQNGAKHAVENAVNEVLNDASTGRRANPHAIGFVRSNSYALTTRDTTYAIPDFFPLGGVAWPEALLALWRSMRYSSLTGVFADLYRAWFTVDNRLVLWDYRSGREFCIYDEIPELISVVGAPLRPLRDVFQPHISFVIPVGTTNMMFLLGLCVVGEGELAEMKVVNLGYSCSTDTVITRVIGSRGRVFCAGADGSLYELRYMRENTPITPKIRMVRYGVWFSNMPVLGQLSSTVSNFWKSWRGARHGGLIDLVVDERDGVLATLCEDSTINLWRLHPSGGISFMVSVPHRPDRLSRLYPVPHGEAAPLTRLFAIETDAQGCRFLATALNGDQFRYRYVNTFDSAFGAELSLQSHTPSYLSGKREISVCYASASVFLAACSDTSSDRSSDEVFAATSPSIVMAPHQNVRDIIASFSGPPSRIVRVDAIEQMPTQAPRNLSDLCAQVCSPGPTYVIIHRHGVSLFAQARPVDTLYLILSTGDADCREGLLGRFTSVYSVPDYASMLLQIAVGGLNVTTERPVALTKDSVLSSSDDDGASLTELGHKLLSGESAEVLRRARELLRNLQLPGTQAAPTSASADVEVQQVVVLMSPFARGLVTFIARALCQLWNTAVGKIMQCNLTPAVRILEKIIQYLDSLSIGGLPAHQRTLDFHQEWQSDKVVVSVPRSRGLRAEDVKRLQASMLYSCYELTHKAWQAATVLQRVLGFPLYTEVSSVTFSELMKDAAIAQRLGHHLSQVMLDSHQGTGADLGHRGVSFSQLQRLCPYFFSGISAQAYQLQNDINALTSGECLQSYTDAQVQKWAAEVGAKAAAYWPSGALQSICEQLRSIRRENVAVELLLHAAAQLDPSNAALDILLAEGRDQACDQTRYGSAYSLHQTKTQVLELVISTLESAWLTHRSVVDDLLGGPRRSGTIWQVEPSDEYAHCFLFEWMCTPRDDRNTTKSLRETLVRAQSPFLGSYLRRNAEILTEEYAHYLANVQGDYQGAMQQCFVMALAPLPDTPVAERLPYRLRCLREALDCARRCQSDQIQQVEQQLRLMEAQQRLYRIVTEFISSGSATLDRRVEWEGQIMTERDVAIQHIEFLSSFVASASDIIEVGGMYPALGGAEVQLDALLCSYVTDVGVFATCVGRAYKNEKDTPEAITKRLIERYYHQISYFPLSQVVQVLEAKSFLRFPAGSAEVVELLLSLSVDPRVLFITYEKILEERDDTGVECVEFRDAGVTRGYLVHAYATVLVCLVDLSRRVSVQQWLVTNAMTATRTMIRRAASAATSPNEQAAVEKAEELLRKANTIATAGVCL